MTCTSCLPTSNGGAFPRPVPQVVPVRRYHDTNVLISEPTCQLMQIESASCHSSNQRHIAPSSRHRTFPYGSNSTIGKEGNSFESSSLVSWFSSSPLDCLVYSPYFRHRCLWVVVELPIEGRPASYGTNTSYHDHRFAQPNPTPL